MNLSSIVFLMLIGLTSLSLKTKYNFIPLLIAFIVIIALRDFSVPDTEAYVSFFQSQEFSFLSNKTFLYEKGFAILTILIKAITHNHIVYFGLLAFLNVVVIGWAFSLLGKRENVYNINYLLIGYLSYISFFGLFYNAIVLRAGLAISCLFLLLVIENKKVHLILITLAFFFHQTSLFFLIGYPFFFARKLTSKAYFLVGILLLVIHLSGFSVYFVNSLMFFLNQILASLSDTQFSKLQIYSKSLLNIEYNISFRLLFYELSFLFFAYSQALNKSLKFYRFLNLYLIGLIISVFFSSVSQIFRLTDFLLISFVFLIWYDLFFVKGRARSIISKSVFFISCCLQVIFFYRILN